MESESVSLIQSFIQWYLENVNYWTVTLLMMVESSCFIPFPSEVVVPPAAYKAASGELNVYLLTVFATVGALIGSTINYVLGYYLGRPIIYRFANSRIGHICLLNQEKIEKAERYFREHGVISTFIGRLIPGLRQVISLPAGLAKMKFRTFLIYTALGAGIWNVILAVIGYQLHAIIPQEQLLDEVNKYSHELSILFIAIAVGVVGFLIYKGRKKKGKDKKE